MIFGFLNEIILKICEDGLPIGLFAFKTVRKNLVDIGVDSNENGAKYVALSCNIMFDNRICFKFFGQIPCKFINNVMSPSFVKIV